MSKKERKAHIEFNVRHGFITICTLRDLIAVTSLLFSIGERYPETCSVMFRAAHEAAHQYAPI